MTCDDCQAIIIDTARGTGVDRTLRDEARRHAALCPACGEQQQEQQWLTTQFRAIAAADAGRQAPERVEIAALAAWRATYGTATAGAPAVGATVESIQSRSSRGPAAAMRWLLPSVVAAGLAAAALALVFVWPASHSGRNQSVAPGSESRVASTMTPTPEPAPASPAASEKISPEPITAGTDGGRPRNSEIRSASVTRGVHLENVMASATRGTTEFLPLPYVEPLRSTEARHVMRVSMTSGDEMILGVLPADRRDGQVFEADVLVGEDGIARAIRVVR